MDGHRTLIGLLLLVMSVRRSQADHALTGDSRLGTKVSIRAPGTPLQDVLREIQPATGVTLSPDRWTSDDVVTVYAYDPPAAVVLRAIARLFRFSWIREGSAMAPRYTLTQTLAERRAEERDLAARSYATAEEIKRDIADLARFADLPLRS